MSSPDGSRDEPNHPKISREFVFEISEAEFEEAHRATDAERKLFSQMKEVIALYRQEHERSTLDIQITEAAFQRLRTRPGMQSANGSHAVAVNENGTVTFHIIPSASTNVMEIRKSEDPDREELVVSAMGLNVFEGRQIRFHLVPINKKGTAEIEDRSDIFPEDLVRVRMLPIEVANRLRFQPQEHPDTLPLLLDQTTS